MLNLYAPKQEISNYNTEIYEVQNCVYFGQKGISEGNQQKNNRLMECICKNKCYSEKYTPLCLKVKVCNQIALSALSHRVEIVYIK